MTLAASDRRLIYDDFQVVMEVNDVNSDPGLDGEIRLRRFAIDGSVMLVATGYDDGQVALALTSEQALAIGRWLR